MGLLEKARYYRMGFRNKAKYWLNKWGMVESPPLGVVDEEQEIPANQIIETTDLSDMQDALDKKILDMDTLFEITKEMNSSLDINDLIQIILLTCMGQMGLSHISIIVKRNSHFLLADQRGLDDIDEKSFSISSDHEFISHCENTGEILTIDEVSNVSGGNDLIEKFRLLKSELIVPLIAKGDVNGLLILGEKMSGDKYSDDEKNFLSMLTSMAAIALDNATLYTNLKKANVELDKNFREFSTLYEISKIINSSDELEEVLSLALETMTTGFGVKCASICLYDEIGNISISSSIGLSENTKSKFTIPKDNARFMLLMETGEPENIEDFKTDPELNSLFDEQDNANVEHFLSVPLISSEKKLGLLNIHKIVKSDGTTTITEKDEKLFALFASQIAPPILATKMIGGGATKKFDLYNPLIEKLDEEISLAKDFNIPLTLILIKLQGAPSHIEEEDGVSELLKILGEILTETQSVFRYGKNRLLLIMPNLSQEESFGFMSQITGPIKSKKNWTALEFTNVNFPGDGESARELLFKIE